MWPKQKNLYRIFSRRRNTSCQTNTQTDIETRCDSIVPRDAIYYCTRENNPKWTAVVHGRKNIITIAFVVVS